MDGTLTIKDSKLQNNKATDTITEEKGVGTYAWGGAIHNEGNLTITNSTLNNNQATATGEDRSAKTYGGAIKNNENLTITDSILNNNTITATGEHKYAYGGAVYNQGNNSLIEKNIFKNNNASKGSAIYLAYNFYDENDYAIPFGYNKINNNTFQQNKANNNDLTIVNYGIDTILKNNNDKKSKYNSTIYIEEESVKNSITNNVFENKTETKLTLNLSKTKAKINDKTN